MKIFSLLLLAILSIGLSTAQAKEGTLFKQLGGKAGITKVVDKFVANVLADESIRPFFAVTANNPKRVVTFKKQLVDQICQASGGTCSYGGKDMKTAHAGMGIRERHFNALVAALTKALDTYKVSKANKGALLAVLGPMKKEIVEVKK